MPLRGFQANVTPRTADDPDLDPRFRAIEARLRLLDRMLGAAASAGGGNAAGDDGGTDFPPGTPPQDEASEFPPQDQPGANVLSGENDLDGLQWSDDDQEWQPFDIRDTFVLKAGDTMTGALGIVTPTPTTGALGITAVGDAENRFKILGDGSHGWGDGTAARDTILYRSAANILKTDDTFLAALGIGAGVSAMEASAILQADSTTKGFLLPRLTDAQSTTLAGIAVRALNWYNTTLGAWMVYSGTRTHYQAKNLFNSRSNKSVSNTTTETSVISGTNFVGSLVIPANWWLLAKTIRFKLWGAHSTTGTPTVTIRLYMGATLLVDSGALTLGNGVTNKRFLMEGEIVCESTGAAGALKTNCYIIMDGTRYEFVQTAGIAVDQTASCTFDITAQFSAASASNIIRSMQVSLDSVP